MSGSQRKLISIISTCSISLVLLLLIDFFFGHMITHPRLRILHKEYHHTHSPDFDNLDKWGGVRYRVCTDGNGFKSACGAKTFKTFDIGIIGDSFTAGTGMPYEDTFVGIIANANPSLRIANLAVGSYSPTIYLTKIKNLIDNGFKFDKLHVYVDISDIQDDATAYRISNGSVIQLDSEQVTASPKPGVFKRETKDTLKKLFPLMYDGLWNLKERIKTREAHKEIRKSILDRDYNRSAWTYDSNISGYGEGGVNSAIEISVSFMERLYELTRENNIRMSVGVYPWPGQLLYDIRDSRHVRIWKNFCINRCEFFFDSFGNFFRLKNTHGVNNVIQEYFIPGDSHFTKKGHQVIADTYFETTKESI